MYDKFFCESDFFTPAIRVWETEFLNQTVTHTRAKKVNLCESDGVHTKDGRLAIGMHFIVQKLIKRAEGTVQLQTTVEPDKYAPKQYRCVCRDDESCGEEFETTLRSPTETTCCPHCGRQQFPKILRQI